MKLGRTKTKQEAADEPFLGGFGQQQEAPDQSRGSTAMKKESRRTRAVRERKAKPSKQPRQRQQSTLLPKLKKFGKDSVVDLATVDGTVNFVCLNLILVLVSYHYGPFNLLKGMVFALVLAKLIGLCYRNFQLQNTGKGFVMQVYYVALMVATVLYVWFQLPVLRTAVAWDLALIMVLPGLFLQHHESIVARRLRVDLELDRAKLDREKQAHEQQHQTAYNRAYEFMGMTQEIHGRATHEISELKSVVGRMTGPQGFGQYVADKEEAARKEERQAQTSLNADTGLHHSTEYQGQVDQNQQVLLQRLAEMEEVIAQQQAENNRLRAAQRSSQPPRDPAGPGSVVPGETV